ncbi:unnamed protein product [Paramecium sonneborni]|uniref:Protein kinase domain-containing protein n=1 Tax=Paramecium sonneborni TaxID=65129 RepID=A0A8S1QWP2_9CILI|nr:unnamed protein product [Paramecium sonneborni]
MSSMFQFENLTIKQTYAIKITQPKIENIELFYFDSNQEFLVKLRNANIYYPCINIKTNQKFSAQQIHSQPNSYTNQEIAVLELLCKYPHTNIIKIYEIIKKDNYDLVLQEEITQNLEQFLQTQKKLTIQMKKNFYCQLLQGFKHLQSKNIILRDLQPKHIAVKTIKENDYILQISDFRSAEISETGKINTINGMSEFAAPETLKESQKITGSCSIYTLGMLLYYICNQGKKPFKANSLSELILQQEEFLKNLSTNQNFNMDDLKLIENYQKMLVYQAEKRDQSIFGFNSLKQEYFLLEDTYFVKKSSKIGDGQQGIVVEAFNIETKENLVCKMIKKDYNSEEILKEVQIYEHLEGHQNQNIIQLKKIIKDSDWYFIFLERCTMNVKEYLNKNPNGFTDLQVIDFLQQIISGYYYIKERNILHRDLKPENIMIKIDKDNYNIYKIIDFGVGKIITSQDLASSDVGTTLFTAPEVLEQKSSYNAQCDIFSIGATLYYMIFKEYYTKKVNQNEILQEQKKFETQPFKCPFSNRNPDIISLIEKMIVYNPKKRISWEQLKNYVVWKNSQEILNFIYNLFLFSLDCEKLLFEIQEKNKDNLEFVGHIQAYRTVILMFAFKIQQKLEQSLKIGSIKINDIEYQIDQKLIFSEWMKKNNLQIQKQEVEKKQQQLSKENLHISNIAQDIINRMNIKEKEITLNFIQVHMCYISLSDQLQNIVFSFCDSLLLKYQLVKMRNLFKDFTHYYPLGQGCQKLLLTKITEEQMQEYINQNQ